MGSLKKNPFKPTAGVLPPSLIGREEPIEDFIEGLTDGPGAPGRLMRITGLRGTGKTVLVKKLCDIAEAEGWFVIREDAFSGVAEAIGACIRDELESKGAIRATIAPKLKVGPIEAAIGDVDLDASIPPERLRDLMGRFFRSRKQGIMIAVDEAQDADDADLRQLASSVQYHIGEDHDVILVFAGLPSMVKRLTDGKTITFMRRALPEALGDLSTAQVRSSFKDTFEGAGFSIAPDVLDAMSAAVKGHPFMMQLVGYYAWSMARQDSGPTSEEACMEGVERAKRRFEQMVIEPALDALPMGELKYLCALAEQGESAETGELASRLGKRAQGLSTIRARLIDASVIEARRRGEVSFTIPYMADYLRDHMVDL